MNKQAEPTTPMIRCNFYIPPDQLEFLREHSTKTNLTTAHLVRDAIRHYARNLGVKLAPESAMTWRTSK
jgi:hypothetical protein